MNIVVVCGMSDDKVRSSLTPIVEIKEIENIYLVRRQALKMSKVVDYHTPECLRWSLFLSEVYRILCLVWICLLKKPTILYGIYFVPHGIYAALAGFLFRKRVIQELIGTDRPKVMRSRTLFWLLKSAERIGVRGSQSAKQLVEIGITEKKLFTPISVNILDYQHFRPKDIPKQYDLIYIGRMDENKQLEILITAIAICYKSNPNIQAVFVGDGPAQAELKRLVSTLRLESSIKFVGWQPYELIPDFLNQARVFMMSSRFEGLPVAMLEALSCGLPVIVPSVGDICDVAVDRKNAYIVNNQEVEHYVNAFKFILDNNDHYQSLVSGALKTRELFITEYSPKKDINNWRSILFSKR